MTVELWLPPQLELIVRGDFVRVRLNGECPGIPGFKGHSVYCTDHPHKPDAFEIRYGPHYLKLEHDREGIVIDVLRSMYGEPNTHPYLIGFSHIDELSIPMNIPYMTGNGELVPWIVSARARCARVEIEKIDALSQPMHKCTLACC